MNEPLPAQPRRFRPEVVRLGLLCAVLYFVQGLCEPSTGMMKQPVNSLLLRWRHESQEVGTFQFLVGLPWTLKLLYGAISDFIPLFGYRRKSWLLAMSVMTTVSFLLLAAIPAMRASYWPLLCWMTVANFSVAFCDVVIDATMVERGQPLGVTGRLQSIQWGSMSIASAIAAYAGGWISEWAAQPLGFGICGALAGVSVPMVMFGVREDRYAVPEQNLGSVLRSIGRTAQSRAILIVAAFLFLWSFNPFSAEVLYQYESQQLELSETDVGYVDTVFFVAAGLAALAYGVYCTRIAFKVQVHLTILFGVLSTLLYWGFRDLRSAYFVQAVVGAVYYTATVMQLDFAARVCPPQLAGTAFAVLMAISNLGILLSSLVGGWLYGWWSKAWDAPTAFNVLVATGAASTAATWLLVPALVRHQHAGKSAD